MFGPVAGVPLNECGKFPRSRPGESSKGSVWCARRCWRCMAAA